MTKFRDKFESHSGLLIQNFQNLLAEKRLFRFGLEFFINGFEVQRFYKILLQ